MLESQYSLGNTHWETAALESLFNKVTDLNGCKKISKQLFMFVLTDGGGCQEMFCKRAILKNVAKYAGKYF